MAVARKHPLLFNGRHLISPPLAVGGRRGPVEVGRRDEIVQELMVHQHALVSGAKSV